ncbi:hypothetical protein IVB08_00190 [Bradyrhizobium sp. 173]|uniref:hypothetical protein n=1 Tax=Bradyrhizobium sp. 173 TaxID=2782644 RepID=UPI001FF97DEC|nr:hypothetical protein [Bradyrhizobium sp. 173]MCK1562430.1 hypothetical protein [Bradyrhizobium sp. 173]
MTGAEIGAWLGQAAVAMGGSLGVLMLALPTKLGDRILGYGFDKKLAALKRSHDDQIERLKDRLRHFEDRGKRIR